MNTRVESSDAASAADLRSLHCKHCFSNASGGNIRLHMRWAVQGCLQQTVHHHIRIPTNRRSEVSVVRNVESVVSPVRWSTIAHGKILRNLHRHGSDRLNNLGVLVLVETLQAAVQCVRRRILDSRADAFCTAACSVSTR